MSTEQILKGLNGKNILITGCSGFLGKVVLEKLLRAVPTVNKIFLLMRGNVRNPSASKRFYNEVATASIFDRLKKEHPGRFNSLCEASSVAKLPAINLASRMLNLLNLPSKSILSSISLQALIFANRWILH